MPFYEYQCRACGKLTEVLQKVSDPPLKKCPECGRSQLVKLVSAPVFRLKGGGWYETDFKSDQENKRNLVGDKEEAAPKADDSKSGEGEKPAEKKPEAAESASKGDKAAKPVAKPVKKPAAKPATARKPTAAARPKKAVARGRR
jgi:putative FmdB family regulatory protein